MLSGSLPGPGPPPPPGPHGRPGPVRWTRTWRWHRNPLRRREDVIEAWIILIVWIVVAVGGVLAGVMAARTTEAALEKQRAERHAVPAVLIEDASRSQAAAGGDGEHVRAEVRWTDDRGVTHTGRTVVDAGHRAGYQLKVWTDGDGRLTPAPPGQAETALQATLLGASASLAFGGMTYVAGRGLRWVVDSRRAAHWDKEWEAVEPHWGHRS